MATVVNSFSITGVDGYLVEVETDIIHGKPSISVVGLGDTAVKEASERLQASLHYGKYQFPKMKVVINLAPGDMKKSGSHFDLAMAVGLLFQSEQIIVKDDFDISCFGFIGELSLNGNIRPCSGVLPMAIAAKEAGIQNLVVPRANVAEAAFIKDINIFSFTALQEVAEFLKGESLSNLKNPLISKGKETAINTMDFREVQGQDALVEFIVVAAAGGHNMMMIGAPGCGKSMIAKRIPTILPNMTEDEALEVTKIYSVSGLLKDLGSLIKQRPFRSPHHNASTNSLIGGGNNAIPGEISLAHNGVLFLDEVAEFKKSTLDALRQPMEDRQVTISRVKFTNTYPCNFMLISAMNPCPCGYYGQDRCRCTDYEVLKYRQRISGPMQDRMDIQKNVSPVNIMELSSHVPGRSSAELKERVEFARDIQNKRFKSIPKVNCNAQMSPSMIKEYCEMEEEGLLLLKKAYKRYSYSARSYHKFLKVARTFADMEGAQKIRKRDIATALMARDLDREQMDLLVV
ncbi:YifB family Mg chelatase-like AAA ATPase [Candidatus Contubernalis alkaliaceticus]|uniref:YifB family Mg chelatase-like AAA ATPase n=1 Tax=Candidatus Contubernalis alkaliaceticus TaxID=338645 RepID=UPI001F4BD579|nr:YifB family Mg chelatase-like AAA ATPase [Candidatus Contubernalis alkalaceticus]UNC93522.1 YifB family Mg chelatase-like AAA ATPase [Candidatus Contubernalis alkalaceticus]